MDGANPELSEKELLQEVGKNVEALGRMLRRSRPLTDEELKDIQIALRLSAKSVKSICKNATSTFV